VSAWTSGRSHQSCAAATTKLFNARNPFACRLFGLLGAGATAGQLAGSAAAGLAAAAARRLPALAAALPTLLMLGVYGAA